MTETPKHLAAHLKRAHYESRYALFILNCTTVLSFLHDRNTASIQRNTSSVLIITVHNLHARDTRNSPRAAVIASISSILNRNQTDLLWMLREEKQPALFPSLPQSDANSDRSPYAKPKTDRESQTLGSRELLVSLQDAPSRAAAHPLNACAV